MRKFYLSVPAAAAVALMGTTALHAQSTQTGSNSASVGIALAGDTGFLTGGQVAVQGTGQGSVSLTRGAANVGVTGGALSSYGTNGVPETSSSMLSTFDFNRTVDSGGALVGIGNVTAQGESIGGIAVLGSSDAISEAAGTRTATADGPGTPPEYSQGDVQTGSADSMSSSQGSLVGSFNTQNTMQLAGTGSLFAGSQALDLGERNAGISAAGTGTITPGTAIDFTGLTVDAGTGTVTGFGAGFDSVTTLEDDTIDINVSNAGEGSILVSGSTGGFFSEGTNASVTGEGNISETNGFFSNPFNQP